mmetsp:Transcript_91876/g.265014  ORF Transcript_91876/g.265014 Transcript_91876/m.265014 type:complete len:238 (-) Transcript_91876:508-1221(-)
MALHVRHLDPQNLLPRRRVPHADVSDRAGCEHLRVPRRKADGVDALVVASVPQLGGQRRHVDPIDVRQRCAAEEVCRIGGERNGRHAAQDLTLLRDLQRTAVQPCDGAIASATKEIPIRQQRGASDPKGETLLWAHLLEERAAHVHLEDVPCRRAAVAVLVGRIKEDVGRHPLHLAEVDLRRPQLLILQVEVPDGDVIVSAGHQLVLRVPQELHRVCGVCGSRRAADSRAPLHLPDH